MIGAIAVAAVLLVASESAAMHGVLCSTVTAPPGAIYLPTDEPPDSGFTGNNFVIDGNDHSYTSGGPGLNASIPGLTTRNETNRQAIIASLSSNQLDNIQGAGFSAGPPMVPSIGVSSAPSNEWLNVFIDGLLSGPHVIGAAGSITGFMSIGTIDPPTPQVTYSLASVTVTGGGYVEGSGIWIVDGDLVIQGGLDFAGLIIVRGETIVTRDATVPVSGNATIYGSLWTLDVRLAAGGSTVVFYSSDALGLATEVTGYACERSSCGDGIKTYDEECDDGNTMSGDCCSATCHFEVEGTSCPVGTCDGAGVCVTTTSTSTSSTSSSTSTTSTSTTTSTEIPSTSSSSSTTSTEVPTTSSSSITSSSSSSTTSSSTSTTLGCPDADEDGLCDADDPCTNVGGVRTATRAKVKATRLRPPGGDDALAVSGVIVVPTTPAIDPMTNGIRILYGDQLGIVFDMVIPGGAYDPATRIGWTVRSTSFKYVDKAASTHVIKVVLKSSASVPGQYKVTVKGRKGSYAVAAPPAYVGVIIDHPYAAGGQCGEWRFPATAPESPSCVVNGVGSVMICR